MPNFNISGPDGHLYSFSAPEGTSQLEALNFASLLNDKRQEEIQARNSKPVTLREAATGGAKRMLGSLETGVSGLFGAEEAAKAGQARQEGITERSGVSLQKVKDTYNDKGLFAAGKEAIGQIPEAIAEQAPNLATTIGGARLGAMAGASFGPYGALIGGLGGAAIPSLFQQAGSNLERQAQEGTPISGASAYAAAVPQAALDVFTDKLLFSKLMGIPVKQLGRGAAENIAKQSLLSTVGKGTAKGIAAEVPTEVAQQMFERMQAGLSLTDDNARKEYADTAYQVALLGPLGAIGNVQERSAAKADTARMQDEETQAAQTQAEQAQRQATGVMEQQPLFDATQAPEIAEPTTEIPVSTVAPDAPAEATPFGFDDAGEFNNAPAAEISPDQDRLFNTKGNPTPEAKASVEAARIQGLPDTIAALSATPEGRAELSSNRKMYFPDLTTKERNAKIVEIQRAGTIVEPEIEGTLTPALLKEYDISPRNKQYAALVGAHLADPTTYNLLTTAAETNTDFGVKANRILDAFPHYNPTAAQPDLFTGEINAPQTKTSQAEPTQQTLFGVSESGVQPNPIEQTVEPSVGLPAQPEEAPVQPIEEPIQRGLGEVAQPATAGNEPPELLPANKPNTLDRFPRVDAIPGINLGPGGLLKPKVVAEGSPLFRETNMDGLNALLRTDRDFDTHNIYISNNPDLALGQGTNKGVNIEFRPNSISGAENVTPGNMGYMGDITGREYVSDIIAPRAISKITITKPKLLKELRWLSGRTLQGQFDRVDNKDGSVTFTRKDLAPLIPANKPNPLAKQAAATLKKEPIATAWGYMSDTPYATLSKVGKDRVRDAHDGAYLDQTTADSIMATEARNKKVTATNKVNVAETPIDETPVTTADSTLLNKALDTLGAGIQQRISPTQNLTPEERVTVTQMLSALGDVMYLLVKKGFTSLASAMAEAKKTLGPNADLISDEQYKQAYDAARAKIPAVAANATPQLNPTAQTQAKQVIANMSGTLVASSPKVVVTPTQVAQNIASSMVKNPTGAFGMVENLANKLRTIVVDKAAHLSASIQDHNDGAFRDINGDIRQDMGLSAANNMQNYINAIFTHGGIEILADKAIRVKTEANSIDGVFRAGKKLADRIGIEDARKLITGAFYHYRAEAVMKLPKADWPKNWLADPRMVPTPAQIKAGMDAFTQFPELEEMRKQFIGSKNQMVNFLFDAGFLTKAKQTAFLADGSYAPWLRLKEYNDTIPGLGNVGRMVDLRQMKALVGGTEEVNDMLENMAQIIGWFARSGIANHTANQALGAMVTMNSAKQFKARPGTGDPSHTVMTYVDGVPTFWQVDNPYDLAAFQTVKGLDSAAMRGIGKALGTLRAGIVLFPTFPLRQVIMDSQRAFVQSGVERPWPMMGKIFTAFLSGEAYRAQDTDIETLRQYGVVGGVDFNTHDTTRGRAKQFGLAEPGNTITDKWMRSPVYNALHTLAYSADLSVRLGIFRQTMEETGDEVLAATRAREIINFQKAGTSELAHTLKQTIPFLGAYLQGMDVNYRSMIGRGNSMKSRKAAASAYWGNLATYAGLVVAYTMCMSGDDEYEEQKGFITDRNFLIPGIGLLPVPTDVGFLGKVIPERITDYIMQESTDNPESAKRLRAGIIQAAGAGFLPPMSVYGITPIVELTVNRSFFSDMPIVSQYYQGLENKEQYTSSTSGFARAIGDAANMSPIQIDYVMNAIGGTSAGAILQLADIMAGDGKMASDRTPIISTFQLKSVGGRYAEEYYAVRELTEKAYKTQKALAERGDEARLAEYQARPEIQARLGARPQVEAIHAMMNNIQHQRKMIEDSDLVRQTKRDRVNELLATQEQMLKEAGIRKKRVEIE